MRCFLSLLYTAFVKEDFLVTRRFSHLIALLIADEANRLKDAGLELIRDLADRGEFCLGCLAWKND
ncbi:MAG: hypothetical protein NVS2B12_20720 [Ktedonobacteraceae bacterium]